VTITNCTISGNSAIGDDGGGLRIDDVSTLKLTNSTVASNSAASDGGGIFVSSPSIGSSSSMTLTNSIIANSPGGGDCRAVDADVTGSYNLIGDSGDDACGLSNGVDSNIIGTDPDLGPLADNGCETLAGNPNGPAASYGCVQTHALLTVSPGIDTADTAAAPDTDQRGVSRPQGPAADIGAYEAAVAAPIPTLSVWGLLASAGLLGLFGARRQRRRR